jgi:hypothetical protein
VVEKQHPKLWQYFLEGKKAQIHTRYLCKKRLPWYRQEQRPAPPILCTYMGRSKGENTPFRFIRNRSKATATNTYLLLYPKPNLTKIAELSPTVIDDIWAYLNSLSVSNILLESRVYGGDLHKIEPKELGNISTPFISSIVNKQSKFRGRAAPPL